MKNLLALAALALTTGCYVSETPEDCEITTTTAKVECELEDNGRYACECGQDGVSGSFVSDNFCALSSTLQDEEAAAGCDPVETNDDGPTFEG